MRDFIQWLSSNREVLESLSYLAVTVGVPLALFEFVRKTNKEARAREYGTYNALDEKYLEFQRLCLDNPELDTFDIPDSQPGPLSPIQQKKQLIAFTMLFSIFERAFLMYRTQPRQVKRAQWQGWADYIESYCARPNFRTAWDISGRTFDAAFQQYMAEALDGRAPDLCAERWWNRALNRRLQGA